MKIYMHIIFWLIVVTLLSIIFTPYFRSSSEAFYFISMLLPVVFGTCYFFNLYLVPQFLFTKKHGKFILYSVYMIIISLYLEMVIIIISLMFLANFSYNNMSPVSSDIYVLAITLYFIVFLFSFLLLIQQTFNKDKTLAKLVGEKEKNQAVSLTVRSERQLKIIPFQDILYMESLADYVKIHLQNKQVILTKEKIGKLEEKLPDTFIRIHRSFIMHKNKVNSFTRESVVINDTPLIISRTYREQAWESLTNG